MARKLDWDITVPYKWTTGPVIGKFLGGLKEHTILGGKCPACKKVFVPPQDLCPDCYVDLTEDDFVELKNEGEIISFTQVNQNFFGEKPSDEYLNSRISPADVSEHPLLWPPEPPYAIVMVKIDGADTAMVHLVKGNEMDKLKVGARAKAKFKGETIGHILDIEQFEIIS